MIRSLWRSLVTWYRMIPVKRMTLELEYFQSIDWGEVDIYIRWFREHFDRYPDKSIIIRKSYSESVSCHFQNVEEQNRFLETLLETVREGDYVPESFKRKVQSARRMYLFDYLQSNRRTHPDVSWLLNHQLQLIRDLEYALLLAREQAPEKHAYYLRLYQPHVEHIREFWVTILRMLAFSN